VDVTRVLVLDLWGTLVATPDAQRHQVALARSAERLGVETTAFCDAYAAKRNQRDTGLWTKDVSDGSRTEVTYLERLVAQSFPTLATTLSEEDIADAATYLFDDTSHALADDRLVPGVVEALQKARDKGAVTVLCSDAGPWMRTALDNTRLGGQLDGIVVSAEVGVRKPDPAAFRAVEKVADELLRSRSDGRPPQFVYIADGGSLDPNRTTATGKPYTELHGADDAEFDSVLQVDHFHERNGELVYERRDTGWPAMLSFHDVPTALFALDSRP
jgi:FMN phosphatase YigB (HAD superfamily)